MPKLNGAYEPKSYSIIDPLEGRETFGASESWCNRLVTAYMLNTISSLLSRLGLGELDRGPTNDPSSAFDSTTQTLAPGRVPTNLLDPSSSSTPDGAQSSSGLQNSTSTAAAISASDIMQLLRVHERRGLGIHGPKTALST